MTSPRTGKRVLVALVFLSLLYAALCLVARLTYPRALFPAPALAAAPAEVTRLVAEGRAELWSLPQPDGRVTPALFLPPAAKDGRVVVMLHGNGETMFDRLPLAEGLREGGMGALLVEYRGYGLAHGPPPAEVDLYDDAARALDELEARGIGRARTAVWGTSLGTAPAAEMARRGRAASLVLVTPFTSIVALAGRIAPFLPVRLLMAHRFDTLAKAGEIRCPTLVVHGDADEIVPFDMGVTVAGAIRGAELVRVPGGHHNDLFADRTGTPDARALFARIARHLARPDS